MRKLFLVSLSLVAATVGCGTGTESGRTVCRARAAGQPEFPAATPSNVTGREIAAPASPPSRLRELDLSVFSRETAGMTNDREAEIDTLLARATIPDVMGHFREGRLTSVELVTYYLRRIEKFDKNQLNSVVEIDPTAVSQAATADSLRAKGEEGRPLLGIPLLLKDNIAAGPDTHTTAGAAALADWRPPRDATLVTNLRRAGAVVLGKTNMSEWANFMDDSMPSGFSAVGGQTANPYGFPTPFGSSSGSAVAAAANLATITIGTETQGSIISPAEINSAVGLKPSRGLVSRDLVVPLYEPQDTAGPLGRNVTDVAIALTALSGSDTRDPRSAEACALFGTDFADFLRVDPGIRVGVTVLDDAAINAQVDEARNSGLDDDTVEMIRSNLEAERLRGESIANALGKSGASVVRVTEPLDPPLGDLMEVLPHGFRRDLDNFLRLNPDIGIGSLEEIVDYNNSKPGERAPYGQGNLLAALMSSASPSRIASAAQRLETDARAAIDAMLSRHRLDVYVTTSNAFDQAGYPAITVPYGYSTENGPSGVTFSGPHLSDGALISTAYAFEQETRAWRPPVLREAE